MELVVLFGLIAVDAVDSYCTSLLLRAKDGLVLYKA